jgi:hypothetical protein
MIEGIIVITCGLMVGIFINVIGVFKNQSFHSKRINELEKKIDYLLKHFER